MAAHELQVAGIGASVLHLATIKPLDTEAVAAFAADHDALVTVEEHQVAGGMGSAVAEFLSETNPTKIARIGIQDQFGQSGEPDELIEHYGMGITSITEAGKRVVG